MIANCFTMDGVLSEFIARTSADPGLASDLLDSHDWNLQSALSAYYVMKGILPGEVPPLDGNYVSKLNSSSISLSRFMKPLYEEEPLETCPHSRPLLKKFSSVELEDDNSKKLTRGISRATENVSLVTKARNEFAQDFGTVSQNSRLTPSRLEIPDYTFTLPDLSLYSSDLREYLERDLIETATLVSLEQAGRLNWWLEKKICRKMWPLATTGDGNCLLHAASLGMWGFHDRLLTLRKALHTLLTSSAFTDAFYRRWRWQTTLQNKEAGLIYCEEEWHKEWQCLLRMSSTEPRSKASQRNSPENFNNSSSHISIVEEQPEVYESLEEVHVLALAHVLRRPVIVIADTMLKDVTGEPFAPIPFGGIYLPLECPASECHRSPLCLTYDSAHFSALVPMDEDHTDKVSYLPAAIPLTDPENKLLPVQFAVDPGLEVRWGQDENDPWVIARLTLTDKEKLILLNEYLDIRKIPVEHQDSSYPVETFETLNGDVLDGKKKFEVYESNESLTDTGISCTGGRHHRSKAARQLQTVAKQFGSIGKSMSRKLKNIGNIARRGGSFKGESETLKQTSDGLKSKRTLSGLPLMSRTVTISGNFSPHQVIVAVLHTEKRHEYQKEMIQNYLSSAKARFEKDKELKQKLGIDDKIKDLQVPSTECVNPGCTMYGTIATSYLCSTCYNRQKQQEAELEGKREGSSHHLTSLPIDGPIVTFGKSAFYTKSDKDMMDSVAKVPLAMRLSDKSCQTFNKSTFYDKLSSESMQTNPSSPLPDHKESSLRVSSDISLSNFRETATS